MDFNNPKLLRLMEEEGYDDMMEFLEDCTYDKFPVGVPAICMDPDCDYTTEMEPDQDRGWCEVCEKNTVKSALVIAGII